jgi:hypothetical protein
MLALYSCNNLVPIKHVLSHCFYVVLLERLVYLLQKDQCRHAGDRRTLS